MSPRLLAFLLLGATLSGCGIAETKLPPEPTVEYLPCSGMDLDASQRVDPLSVLVGLSPDLEQRLWGGLWTEGDELHVGITDVGEIDWQVACPEIDDPGLVVHEVPFVLGDLQRWSQEVDESIETLSDPDSMSHEMLVVGGQYVIEVRADSVEQAGDLTEGIPLDAWTYGGPVSSGS
jgi:hypothetical protein